VLPSYFYTVPWLLIHFKGLLAVPFVLHSQPTAVFEENAQTVHQQASVAQRRYAEIMRDVEDIINDHSKFEESLESSHRVLRKDSHSLD
jgi:hypothetical protein